MDSCTFCKIIKGEIPSKKIYEDDKVLCYMDINPVANGHLLVVPKKHVKDIFEVDNETFNHMMDIIKNKITPILKEKLKINGLTIIQNNGYGQEVKHLHIHLIPRYNNDGFKSEYNKDEIKDIEDTFKELNG